MVHSSYNTYTYVFVIGVAFAVNLWQRRHDEGIVCEERKVARGGVVGNAMVIQQTCVVGTEHKDADVFLREWGNCVPLETAAYLRVDDDVEG